MADKTDEKTPAPETAKGGFLDNKLVLLGVIVVLQALMAVAIVQFVIVPKLSAMGTQIVEEQQADEPDDPLDSVIVSLNELVVSLQGSGSNYLKINIDLEVRDQDTADIVTRKLPKLRHIAIMALTTKSAADLNSRDGKAALDAELKRKFGDVLPKDSLLSVFFSDLVIQ